MQNWCTKVLKSLCTVQFSGVLWPHDAKSQLIGKDPDVGKD